MENLTMSTNENLKKKFKIQWIPHTGYIGDFIAWIDIEAGDSGLMWKEPVVARKDSSLENIKNERRKALNKILDAIEYYEQHGKWSDE